jgi:autotransporter-associated beta strand protein
VASAWLVGLAASAQADTHTWDGGAGAADRSWSNALNWVGDVLPDATDSVVFTNTGAGSVNLDASNPGVSNIDWLGSSAYYFTNAANTLNFSGTFTHSNTYQNASTHPRIDARLAGSGSFLALIPNAQTMIDINNLNNAFTGGVVLRSPAGGKLYVAGGGALGFGTLTLDSGTLLTAGSKTITNAVVLGGDVSLGWNSDTLDFTGPFLLTADRTLTINTTVKISAGGGSIGGDYVLRLVGAGSPTITRDNSGWGGTVIMELPAGNHVFFVGHANACGSKLVLRGGILASSASAVSLASSTAIVLDGDCGLGWLAGVNFDGPVTLTGNRTLSLGKDATFAGGFSSTNRYTLTKAGTVGILYLSGNNSTYTGDWSVAQGTLAFSAANALGAGQVWMATSAVAQLNVAADWALTNDFSGSGTIKLGTVNGKAHRNLSLNGGMIAPGATATNAGVLTIQNTDGTSYNANVAFGAGSRLAIDVTGTNAVAGTDHDQLHVARGTVTGLDNLDLYVSVAPSLGKIDLTGKSMTVLVADTGTVSTVIHALHLPPTFSAKVNYATNAVLLVDLAYRAPGTAVFFR